MDKTMGGNKEKTEDLSPLKRSLVALREMRGKLDAVERARTEPIAIVGMSCRFPGGVEDPDSFWQLLVEGRDAISDVPPDRWDKNAYFDPDPDAPGKMSTTLGGFLDRVDGFDAQFWGLSPRETATMDPQHRLLLETSWEALENAGHPPDKLVGSQTGVFIGLSTNDYVWLQLSSGDLSQVDAYMGTGNLFSVSAGRIAYLLGLQGPALVVDTACSSSLVATHLACQSLRAGKCNQALVGGVGLILSPIGTIQMSKSRALAEDGRCKTFDAGADGYVRGEGCGVVVLKRLSDALSDGDNILALIRGTAMNHDGRSSGLTVPNGQAQKAVIEAALHDAGDLDPNLIDYIEAHGTGTPLGDPIELRALAGALVKGRDRKKPLIVGSVKTNIGHTEAAAGVASLIKTVLALKHGLIPKHLHLKTPTPHFEWDTYSFSVPTGNLVWPGENGRRLAGISSFGFSGTNAHLVLESAPARDLQTSEVDRPLHLLALSAKGEAALNDQINRYKDFLISHPDLSLADVAYSANTGRTHFSDRIVFQGHSSSQILGKMEALAGGGQPEGVFKGRVPGSGKPKVAFLFTGQGSQFAGMGRQLYETHPVFQETINLCDQLLRPHLDRSLISILFPGHPENDLIHSTEYTQPALFALEYALARLWQSWGIMPSAVMGHSVGEFVAACIAGVFSLEDGLKLVAERGRLMGALPRNGAMAAVFADEARVASLLPPYAGQVSIAATNGPQNIVISGLDTAVQEILQKLEDDGIKSKRLNVSHAFHSPLMESILDQFGAVAASVDFSKPKIKLISNVTGKQAGDEIRDPAYWQRHVRQAVRFAESVEVIQQLGCTIYLEIGPRPAMIHMAQQCLPPGAETWLASLSPHKNDWEQVAESLANMHLQGIEIDWVGVDSQYARKRVNLPTYPFQRQRYWWKALPGSIRRPAAGKTTKASHPFLGQRLPSALKDIQYEVQVGVHTPSFLADRLLYKRCFLPESAYVEICIAAGSAFLKTTNVGVENVTIHDRLDLNQSELNTLQIVLSPQGARQALLKIYASHEGESGSDANWRLMASTRIVLGSPVESGRALKVDEISSRCREIDIEDWRLLLQNSGLEHRNRFQVIDRVWRTEAEALARLTPPADSDPYFLHPALLDSVFQLFHNAGSPGIYLPVTVERVHVYSQISPTWCWASTASWGEGDQTIDLFFYDEDGQAVAEVVGARLALTAQNDLLEDPRDFSSWFYDISWPSQALATQAPLSAVDPPGSWVIFADEGGLGEDLRLRLENLGEWPLMIYPGTPPDSSPPGQAHTLDPLNPESYQAFFLDLLGQAEKPLRGLIYLWGLDAPDVSGLSAESLSTWQLSVCGGGLHLVQALAQAMSDHKAQSYSTPPRLWIVTRGAQPVSSGQVVSPTQASLWGLGKTISLELPKLWGGLVDLDPEYADEEADLLLSEFLQPDGETQIAYRDMSRHVARLERRAGPQPPAARLSFRPDAAYLVTGGLGGLGLQTAHWMAENGARRIILMSRTGLPDRSLWSQDRETRLQAAQIAAIKQIEALGATVFTAAVDISDEAGLDRFLDEYKREGLPEIRGVMHAAGTIRDRSLLQMDLISMSEVFKAKIRGSWLLHEKLGDSLDFFVLFSSSAAVGGAMGQANYAAANAFMDGLAHYRRSQGETALTVNWGPWSGAGMAARADLEKKRARLGLGSIAPHQGFLILERLLYSPETQVAVIPIEPGQFSVLYPGKTKFLDLLQAEKPGEAEHGSIAHNIIAQILKAAPEQRLGYGLAHLKERIARVLMMDSANIPVERSLMELGFDSIMIMELIRILDRDLGITLYPREVFEQPSINSMAGYIVAEIERLQGLDGVQTSTEPGSEPDAFDLSPKTGSGFLMPTQRNPRMAFLLSSPRSGSTLLRVMLAGHPAIFGPPELHLLPFSSLNERKIKLEGSYLDEGLLRALMELMNLDAVQSQGVLDEWLEADLSIQDVYLRLQELAHPRLLVDKSPSYGLDIEVLERAEALFQEPKYIHLVRHPYAVIDSFVRARLDKLFENGHMDPTRLGEHTWATATGNTLDFLASIDPRRHLLVKYEDLVTDPAKVTTEICDFLEIPFDPALLDPYQGNRMTDGAHGKSLSIGDPNFLKRSAIDPTLADAWKNPSLSHRLGGFARRIAVELGYDLAAQEKPPIPNVKKHRNEEIPPIIPVSQPEKLLLSFAQQRMLLLDQIDPGMPTYNIPITLRLTGTLDIAALEQSLNAILHRHAVLRTRFTLQDQDWYQDIDPAPDFRLRKLNLQEIQAELREEQARQIVLEEVSKPFNLESDLKLRAVLLKLSPEAYILSITVHHIAADGWSLGVLLNELAAHYQAFTAGNPSPLPPLPVQYTDYALWQREWLKTGKPESQISYWMKRLGENPSPVLELYTDYPRPVKQTHSGDRLTLRLPSELTSALKKMSARSGATLFMTLLAALNVLLHRYTGQEDISIGAPVSGRNQAELTRLIGLFVNTLVMRADLSSNPAFRQLLSQVKQTALEAFENQDLPFEQLIEELDPERNLSYSPLFQVMFVLQNSPMPGVELPGLKLSPMENIHTKTAKFDLLFSLTESGTGLEGFIDYNTDLFDRQTIERMAVHLENLLQNIVAAPDLKVTQLEYLSEAEKQELLVDWNSTRIDYSRELCLHRLIEAQVEKTPQAVAVMFEDQSLTYHELDERANRLAAYLQKLGVKSGEPVGIHLERSIEMLVSVLGVLKAGGAYVPLDPAYPIDRLAYMIEDTQTRLVITQDRLAASLPVSPGKVVRIDSDWAEIVEGNLPRQAFSQTSADPAYIIYTSGSTGRPKGVKIPHRAAVHFVHAMQQKPGLKPDDTLVAVITLSFDMSVFELFLPLAIGAKVVIASAEVTTDGHRLSELLASNGATVLQATPTTWQLLLNSGWEGDSRLKAITGGEALSRLLASQLLAQVGELWNMYGPTEITVYCTGCQIMPETERITIGQPVANTQAYILDNEMQLVPTGVAGELYIGGEGLADGYLNLPELTAEKFVPNPFSQQVNARLYRTGDLVRYLPDGNIEYLGRKDNQIKIRGFRVEPGEIETVLSRHPAIREAVVTVRDENPGDKRLIAYSILDTTHAPTVSELRSYLREQLPEYMLPANFVFLDAFPLTTSKKINRKALPAPANDRPELNATYIPPKTPEEIRLSQIWSELLHLDKIGLHDNFFDLGGHSLQAAQVIARMNESFKVKLHLRSIFDSPTIAQMVVEVKKAANEDQKPVGEKTDQIDLETALRMLEF